jgi:signal transduction histidine kinase
VIVCIVVGGLSATGLVFVYVRNVLTDLMKNHLELTTRHHAENISLKFHESSILAQTIARDSRIRSYMEDATGVPQDGETLTQLMAYNIGGQYSAIYLMGADGITRASTDPAFVGNDYSFREYFTEAMAGRYATDIAIGVTSGKLGYYFSAPIANASGTAIGVVVAKLEPERINEIFESKFFAGRSTKIMFADEYGVIVYSNMPERAYKTIGALSASDRALLEKTRRYTGQPLSPLQYDRVQQQIASIGEYALFEFFDEEEDEREIMSVGRVDRAPFFILFEENNDMYFAAANAVALIMAFFVVVMAVVIALVVSLALRIILSPLERLRDAMEVIAKSGDMNQTVRITTGDEIQSLGDRFNELMASVRASRAEIERKVTDQTQEIRDDNKELQERETALTGTMNALNEEKKIGEKARAESKAILESVTDGIIAIDRAGNVLFSNEAATSFFPAESIGAPGARWQSLSGLLHEDGTTPYPPGMAPLSLAATQGKKIRETMLIRNARYPEGFFVRIDAAPIALRQGEQIGGVAVLADISQEKKIDKAKNEFVSLAAHQLRTPLSAIRWYLEMLLSGDAGALAAEQKRYVKDAFKSNIQMIDLVNDFLNMSRLDLGVFSIRPKPTDIVGVSKHLLHRELAQEIKKKQLHIAERYPKALPHISVDPALMRIILENLFTNAVKYTPMGGSIDVAIQVKEKEELADGRIAKAVRISVADTGCGIPASQQDQIFTKLFRADNVRLLEEGGTGIGLYMVKMIVTSVGGRVWFASEEGKGSVFFASIPFAGMPKKEGGKTLE